MPNNFGTLSSALVIQRALELVFTKRPLLRMIATDFSGEAAKLDQTVISRIHSVPPVNDFGTGATDRADTDVPVTINQFKEIHHSFTIKEITRTSRNLVDESAEPIAVAFANFMVDQIAALWSTGNFPKADGNESVEAIADFDYQTLTHLRKVLNGRGVSDFRRFLAVNSDVYEALLNDPTIIEADKNPRQDAIESGEIRGVSGFSSIMEYPDLPTANNLIGFAGVPDSAILAARVPRDPRELLPNADFPGQMGVVTDPRTGLSVMVNEWIEPSTLKANVRLVWMYGTAKGNANNGQRVVSTAT